MGKRRGRGRLRRRSRLTVDGHSGRQPNPQMEWAWASSTRVGRVCRARFPDFTLRCTVHSRSVGGNLPPFRSTPFRRLQKDMTASSSLPQGRERPWRGFFRCSTGAFPRIGLPSPSSTSPHFVRSIETSTVDCRSSPRPLVCAWTSDTGTRHKRSGRSKRGTLQTCS